MAQMTVKIYVWADFDVLSRTPLLHFEELTMPDGQYWNALDLAKRALKEHCGKTGAVICDGWNPSYNRRYFGKS